MEKLAIIWRESAYKNNYTCKCGAKLSENGSEPDYCLVYKDMHKAMLKSKPGSEKISPCFCTNCHEYVAYITKIDAEEGDTGKLGNLDEYIERRKQKRRS